jgi:hypothetical protein
MENQNDREKGSRRAFLNRSVLTAAAGAFAAAQHAHAAETEGASIHPSEAFNTALKVTPKPAAFPMRGAQVFAKVCKDEGLAALFCCPGNYGVINAIAEEGIPCYGGRTEGSMCAAADGFARIARAGSRQQQEHRRRGF